MLNLRKSLDNDTKDFEQKVLLKNPNIYNSYLKNKLSMIKFLLNIEIKSLIDNLLTLEDINKYAFIFDLNNLKELINN